MEAQKGTLKHKWRKRHAVLKTEQGENWTACLRCGVILRADGKNKNKPCPGVVKITPRKKNGN